jgi:hypothetical protein
LNEFEAETPTVDAAVADARDTVSRPLITLLVLAAVLVAAIAVWRIARPDPAADPAAVTPNAGTPSAAVATPAAPMLMVEKLPVRLSADRALVYRGKGTDQQKFLADFGRALAPYREDRFEDAVTQMRALAAVYKDAPEPPLYEGVSLLMLQRSVDAVKAFERARKLAGKGAFARDAQYYHAVSLVLAGRPAGRGAIQRVCELDGPYKAQACQALKSLSPKR